VIEALNAGISYGQFIEYQLAADAIAPDDPAAQRALGFLGLGPKYYDRRNPAVMAEEWSDRVDVVSQGLLGLTVACARCHDHKYDPISTADYYALAGVFASTQMFNRPLDKTRELNDQGQTKDPIDALHVVRDGEPHDLTIYLRGDVKAPGPVTPRRFLQVLAGDPAEVWNAGSGRRQLAAAIADPANPLTSRVLVNRVWGAVFGRPLVSTPSNFGRLGDRPTHPQLLDDLAARFAANAGSWKTLIRELVTSAAFRQESQTTAEIWRRDPDNRYLARMNRRRLSIEQWRDAALMAAGRMDATVGGESIEPEGPEVTRRTVYSRISRLKLNPMLALFDFPDPNNHAAGRVATTTPLQKLFLLNNPFVVQQSQHIVHCAIHSLGDATAHWDRTTVDAIYRQVLSRGTADDEWSRLNDYARSRSKRSTAELLAEVAQVVLISNEALFVD
jgi:hypothetical protein